MSSSKILARILADKSALRDRIAARRIASAEAIRMVVRPLAMLDRCVELWRDLPPVMRVTGATLVGLAARRWLGTRRFGATLVRWIPVLLGPLGS
jgi:hypothetical protein